MFVNRCILLLVPVLLASLGCAGDDTIQWSGEVTFEGEPVESGIVRFESVDGSVPTTGSAITEGKYSVDLVPGEYHVDVSGMQTVGTETDYETEDETYEVVEEVGTYRETVTVTESEVRDFSLEAT